MLARDELFELAKCCRAFWQCEPSCRDAITPISALFNGAHSAFGRRDRVCSRERCEKRCSANVRGAMGLRREDRVSSGAGSSRTCQAKCYRLSVGGSPGLSPPENRILVAPSLTKSQTRPKLERRHEVRRAGEQRFPPELPVHVPRQNRLMAMTKSLQRARCSVPRP